MNYKSKIKNINEIYRTREFASGNEVLLNKKHKLLLGASFDNIYYYEFFVLFTGVQKSEIIGQIEEYTRVGQFLEAEILLSLLPRKFYKTRIVNPGGFSFSVVHKGLYYHLPQKPYFVSPHLAANPETVKLMNLTDIIDACLADSP